MSRDFMGNEIIANEEELYQSNYFKLEDKFIIDDEKIKEIYGGDYKKALVEVGKNERKYVLKCYILEQKIDKYKKVLDKIKEYIKNNEKCIVECSGRDIMTGMPYEKIKTGLIEKERIEKLLEEIE